MRICYIDEAGCTGVLPTSTSPIAPVIAIVGVFVDQRELHALTMDLIRLKRTFFPGLLPASAPLLEWILAEVKGSEVRKNAASASRRESTHAIGLLDKILDLVERRGGRVVGRVWIKGVGSPIDGTALYTSSIQAICNDFQHHLCEVDDGGVVIADSRTKGQNAKVAHSIFTQKYQVGGDYYDRILEMPTFGHSDNHSGLQVADLLCSALIFAMAVDGYCAGLVNSVHVRPGYSVLRPRFGPRLMRLQHRYQDSSNRWRGGLTVSDGLLQRPGVHLFRVP